ncbi:MAG: metalloregulator ArsR/SmtB family transcription factor [Nanoarchaeota archaeon]
MIILSYITNLHRLFFKAFSNETRLDIINLLKSKPLTVSEICEKTGFEQSRVSHNLRCLQNCGFVQNDLLPKP